MGEQKRLRCSAGVITGAIMDQKQVRRGLGHDPLQKGLVTFRVKPALDALIEQTPGEILNGAKDFVAFALATGGHLGLLTTSGPRVAQRAPLGKAGLILKENQPSTPFGRTQNRWPFVLQPRLAAGGVEMIRHETRLLKRKPQVVQQRTHIMSVVEHAELTPDQHPQEDGGPTGGLTAHHEWPRLDQRHQAFLLLRRQLRAAPTAMAVNQAVHAAQQEGLTPPREASRAERPLGAEYLHGHMVHQQVEQDRGPSHQTHIIALIGMLQTALESFDGGVTELYPNAHGCILLWSGWVRVLGEIHPCAHGSQPQMSNFFSKDL